MLALELDKSTVKSFMGRLLREDVFDIFEVRSVEITTTTHINIDGQLEPDAADEGNPRKPGFSAWEALRPLVYAIIKASPKPKHVKIVFSYKASEACEIHSNAAALFLNFVYENDSVFFTTGTAQREFLFEKSLDTAWDQWVKDFFVKAGLQVADRE